MGSPLSSGILVGKLGFGIGNVGINIDNQCNIQSWDFFKQGCLIY